MIEFLVIVAIIYALTGGFVKWQENRKMAKLFREDCGMTEAEKQAIEIRGLKKVWRFTFYFFLAFFALIALLIGVPALLGY